MEGNQYFLRALERFHAKYKIDESGCWMWTHFANPYGCMTYHDQMLRAHRFSYMAFVGDIPDDMVIMHLCQKHRCVNPSHLKVATDAENISYDLTGRLRMKCKRGHSLDGENVYVTKRQRKCKVCMHACARRFYYSDLRATHARRHASYMRNRKLKMVSSRYATACKYGHPYTPENTYHAPRTGWRQCKACKVSARAEANGLELRR